MSTTRNRAIVVGVDGTAGSSAALEFAFVEALDRGAPVVVVTTWMPELPGPYPRPAELEDPARAARRMQEVAIGRVVADLGELPDYTQVVVNDVSGPALVEASRDAALLVVGTGRKDALSRAFLGSVSEFCVRHSAVPVVVVPAPRPPSPFAGTGAIRSGSSR